MATYPNWFATTAQANFETYLAEFKDKPNLKFLQLGVFTGDATVWLCNNILTDKSSKLIDVDTWEGSDEESHAEMDFSDVYQVYQEKVKDLPVVSVVSDTHKYLIRQLDNFISAFDFIYIDADEDTLSIIKKYHLKSKFLIHCFTGGLEFAKKLLELGCLISFSGIITFKKSSDLRNVVKYVPIEKMLIETDSPYLSPDPFRGKSNEPANVKIVAENVALIKDISFDEVANITTRNFKNFFFNEKN